MNQTLIQEILEVVEQAAIASAKLTGLGQKDEADAAAVEAMRLRMGKIEMKGKIVIGEGERDEAPMLYIGEEVGSGSGPGVDFAVDPCEGTNLCANNQRGSMAVLDTDSSSPNMAIYQGGSAVGNIDLDTGYDFIPIAEDNTDYQDYLAWVAEGNTAEAAD